MAFNALFKKGRLIWDEYYPSSLTASCINPKISFDAGRSWMSLLTQAQSLREGSSVYGGSIKNLNSGFKQLDLMFGFTPNAIPKIAAYELEADGTNGLDPGTYYFAVSCINYDTPCVNEATVSENFYVTGSEDEPFSRLVEVVIAAKSNVKLYINYPEYTKGLAVYYGASTGATVDLELYHVTNFVNVLKVSIADATSTDPIQLTNLYPFPQVGTVKIENEYIDYTGCSWNTDHFELTGITRGVRSSTGAAHLAEVNVYAASYEGGGLYGEIPPRLYSRPEYDSSLVQYINFDNNRLLDFVGTATPTSTGDVNFSTSWTVLSSSLKLVSAGYVDTDLDLNTYADAGSIHFYIAFDSFNDDAGLLDPYIFGTAAGLWMKINRITMKPYFGYGDVTIVSGEDFRVPSLSKDNFDRIGLSWVADPVTELMTFNLTVNGYQFITEETEIAKYDALDTTTFTPGTPNIGGTTLTAGSNDSFYGYIDDWKVYNTTLTLDEFEAHHSYLLSKPNVYCGLIEISATGYDNINTVANETLEVYEPLIHKVFSSISTVEDDAGIDFGVYYDDWIVEKFLTDASVTENEKITYPVDPDYVQVRFDFTGDVDGFYTPVVKNIALIISEGALG